jgi:hypothetical protein
MRARNGDWSLYHPEAKDQKLLSGSASKVGGGPWDRPIERDYELAWMMYRHFIAREAGGQETGLCAPKRNELPHQPDQEIDQGSTPRDRRHRRGGR